MLLMRPFMMSPDRGAATTIHLATAPELSAVTGKYFDECREKTSSPLSHDEDLQERLWRESEKLVGRG